jgi:hypothetical protein
MKSDPEVKPPNISKETMRKMSEFFSKTSHPRIIIDINKQENDKGEE